MMWGLTFRGPARGVEGGARGGLERGGELGVVDELGFKVDF